MKVAPFLFAGVVILFCSCANNTRVSVCECVSADANGKMDKRMMEKCDELANRLGSDSARAEMKKCDDYDAMMDKM